MSISPTPAAVHQLAWFPSLPEELRDLIMVSLQLLEREQRMHTTFYDYAFILFPMVKAYEGFIKFFLYQQGMITYEIYQNTRFRIGRSLNPDVSERQRDSWWLYDDVVRSCGSDVAHALWQAWLECRNHVVHFFPDKRNHHGVHDVEVKMIKILEVMEMTMYCTIREPYNTR